MTGEDSMATKVLDALVGTGLLTTEQLSNAQEAAAKDGVSVGAHVVERGLVSADDIGNVLEEEMGVPRVDLSSYAPEDDALALVPAGIAREKRLLPLFDIEGILTAAIGDPVDVFSLDEVGASVGVEIEPVLTGPAELLEAIVQYYGGVESQPAEEPAAVATPSTVPEEAPVEDPSLDEVPVMPDAGLLEGDAPPVAPVAEVQEPQIEQVIAPQAPEVSAEPAGEPQSDIPVVSEPPMGTMDVVAEAETAGAKHIDLDVLAVADSKKVAVLVADIIDEAVRQGASNIQVLPYKDDFFLVFRVKGSLEKIASAPISLQGALVEGLKAFARLSEVSSSSPALGRIRAHYGDRDLAITVSAVPTVAGQRVVITLRPNDPQPKGLDTLGMSDAEQKALHAMVGRGRGLLLVCGPVAGGRSATYYSLLAHGAQAGKTIYSVERSIGYELPAVAQVMVNPGSPVRPSAYIAAGLQQDTDVMAVDSLQSVEDVHLAVEAAGRGRLVVGTFAAADIMSGVRRILDMGAEPHGLAAALTVAVGQRLVRTNCPNCSEDVVAKDAGVVIPGLDASVMTRKGTGCPNCRNTGFAGVTGIFEVLPFTEPVRTAVAAGADLEGLMSAAKTAGMRDLTRSGLAKVEEGTVSVEELDRVLRLQR